MKYSALILSLLIAIGSSLLGLIELNEYAGREGLFPRNLSSSDVILTGTPTKFQKNKHVNKEVSQKKGQYQIKYAFKDHMDIPRIWSVSFPTKQMEEMIYKFGVSPTIYDPFERTSEAYIQRKREIIDGLFTEKAGFVVPDFNAMATYYRGYTKPIADYAKSILGSNAGGRQLLEFVLSFCQDIPYGVPPQSFNGKEIGEVFSPPQALLNMYGDCDSKAVLFASAMSHFGPQDMIYIKVPGHLLVGVEGLPRPYETHIKFKNKSYILAEPVGPGRFKLGRERQQYSRIEGVEEVSIDADNQQVTYEFAQLEENDPFYLSVKNNSITSYPINLDETRSPSNFGNRSSGELGQLSVWINSPDYGEVAVWIDNEKVGSFTQFFNETPTCGQSGTVSAVKPPGSYHFKAQSPSGVWEGDISISAGSCLMLEIGN